MSRIEKFPVPRNFTESGVESYKKMVTHIDRRTKGRKRVETEIEKLMEGIVVLEEGTIGEKEGLRRARKTEIVSSYPLGWTKIKRY